MLITTSDFLIRIKNGYMAYNDHVIARYSKMNEEVGKLLVKLGYIESIEIEEDEKHKKNIIVTLRYVNGKPALQNVKLISKPGRKIYIKASRLKPIRGGLGHALIVTSKGVLTNKEAREMKMGGEVICYVW